MSFLLMPGVAQQARNFIKPFEIEIDTTLGNGENNFQLPFRSGYDYDCYVDKGDGSPEIHITAYDDPETLLEYSQAGNYTVKITGVMGAWYFNNGGDKLKVTAWNYYGVYDFHNQGAFYGCRNLTGNLPKIPNFLTHIRDYFSRNVGLTGDVYLPDSIRYIGPQAFSFSDFNGSLRLPEPGERILIQEYCFQGTNFVGDLYIPKYADLRRRAFYNNNFDGDLVLPEVIFNIDKSEIFYGCSFKSVKSYLLDAPAVKESSFNFSTSPVPLHIRAGASGYDVSPWTDTSIFSEIIEDLWNT